MLGVCTFYSGLASQGGIMEGIGRWISLHQKIIEWEWFKGEMHHFKVFIYCLIKANYRPSKWQGIDVERGQFITGLKSLSENTGLPVHKLRIILRDLKMTGEIAIKSSNKYSIISVTNYEKYQCVQSVDSRPEDNQIANKAQSNSNQIATTNKNNKNNKKEEEEAASAPPARKKRTKLPPPPEIPISAEKLRDLLPTLPEFYLPTASRITEQILTHLLAEYETGEVMRYIGKMHEFLVKKHNMNYYKSIGLQVKSWMDDDYKKAMEKENGRATKWKDNGSSTVQNRSCDELSDDPIFAGVLGFTQRP
jgi:predicted transcriptional regulator